MPSKDFKDDVDDPNGYYSPTTSHPATIEVARQPVIASIKPRTIALSIRQTANDYLGSDSNADIDIQYLHAGQQFDHDALLSLLTPYHEVIGEPENGVIYISIFAVPTKRWSIGNKFDLSAVMREIYASGFSYGILTMRPWLFVSADTHIPSHAFLPSVPKGASLTTSPLASSRSHS